MANINITVGERLNTPPTINNISVIGSNRITRPVTMDDFISIGGYQDAQGDPLGRASIDSLPAVGSLVLGSGNTPVTIGQQILNTDILANNLKYIPVDTHALTNSSFNFRVSDSVAPSNFSAVRQFQIQNPVPPTYGFGTTSNGNINVNPSFSIIFNWNSRSQNNYRDFNLGLLREDTDYANSPIWSGSTANKLVIESFTDEIIVTNQTIPKYWDNYTVWSPLPAGFNQKQILDSSTGNPITLPYTLNLPGGNNPVTNVGLKIDFQQDELMVPSTAGSPYASFTSAVRRLVVGYKIYSGNVAQTPTLYHMWYRVAIRS